MASVIAGVVRDAAGRPVGGARVYFTAGPGAFPDVATLTDRQGAFSLTAPRPGEYEIECTAEPHGSARARVKVAGRQARVELRLA